MIQSVYDDLSIMPDGSDLAGEYDELCAELDKLTTQVGSIMEHAFRDDPSGLQGIFAAGSRINKKFELIMYGIDELVLLRKNGAPCLVQAFFDRSLSYQSM